MNKRGTASDVIFFPIAFFILITFFVISFFFFSTLFTALIAVPAIGETPGVLDIVGKGQEFFNNLDKLAIGFFMGLFLALIITSWFVAGHPAGMVIYFLVGVGAVLGSMMISNAYQLITDAAVFGSAVNNLDFADHIMNNLAFYTGLFYLVGIIITFVKPQITGGSKGFTGGSFQ